MYKMDEEVFCIVCGEDDFFFEPLVLTRCGFDCNNIGETFGICITPNEAKIINLTDEEFYEYHSTFLPLNCNDEPLFFKGGSIKYKQIKLLGRLTVASSAWGTP